jgi:hypothetical protein
MTRQQVADLMERIFDRLRLTREAGQKEYAHSEDNAFANFERVAKDLDMSKEKVLWVYTRKHIDGVVSWLKGHKSQREDVRGRILDIIVYLILLWAMIEEEEGKTAKSKITTTMERDPLDNRT